jgi:hypothetical protein
MPKSDILTHQAGPGCCTRIFCSALNVNREIRLTTYSRLQVPVRKVVVVHKRKALEELLGDATCLELLDRSAEMLLEVTSVEVFHGNEDRVFGFVPTERSDEMVAILPHQ